MSKETFTLLVSKTGPAIPKLDTHHRRSVSVEEQLLITWREGPMYQNTMLIEAEDDISIRPRGIVPENSLAMPRRSPQNLRNHLANFFITDAGALPWQWKYCVIEQEN
ncbi:hypothetical protein JTB14_023106 [Gonioctena quinquepunctata]|nr:hypothetical protein JTB14_023106 [Gonioctena quinquepunctata]